MLKSDERSRWGYATLIRAIDVYGRIPGSASAPQNLYIEGYGAIFFLNVNYPLLPPPAKERDADAKEKTSSEWEEARREISQPGPHAGPDPFMMLAEGFDGGAWGGRSAMEYDVDKVEELKKDLISSLKNAAHIRKLKSDETITIVVAGASSGITTRSIRSTGTSSAKARNDYLVMAKTAGGERGPVNVPVKLIVRARKSDAEGFQNGKLSFDEFRKKVTVMLY